MTQKPLSEGESDTANQTQKWAEVSKSHVYSAFKDSMSYTYCCLGLELILHDFTWFMLRPCHRILSKLVLCKNVLLCATDVKSLSACLHLNKLMFQVRYRLIPDEPLLSSQPFIKLPLSISPRVDA